MGYRTYTPGQRVAALRNVAGKGTCLDYSGTVQKMDGDTRVVLTFSDGESVTMAAHSDFIMTRAESNDVERFA